MQDYKSLICDLNNISKTNNFNFDILAKHPPFKNIITIIFPETKNFKEQYIFVDTKKYTLKDFVNELENELKRESADDIAIFMFQRLRKTSLTLKETINEAEKRKNQLIEFANILLEKSKLL